MPSKPKIIIGSVAAFIIVATPFAYVLYQTSQMDDPRTDGPTVQREDERQFTNEERAELDRFTWRRDLPGRSSQIISNVPPPKKGEVADDKTTAMTDATDPVDESPTSQFFGSDEDEPLPSDDESIEQAESGVVIDTGPLETVETTDEASPTTDTTPEVSTEDSGLGGTGIEVVGVEVRDTDNEGEQVAWSKEGTIVGLDQNEQHFVLAIGDGSDSSYRIHAHSDTEVYVQQNHASFSALSVGDIVEVDGRAAATSKEIDADLVRVVAELQLFDDGQ